MLMGSGGEAGVLKRDVDLSSHPEPSRCQVPYRRLIIGREVRVRLAALVILPGIHFHIPSANPDKTFSGL